jgi:hypothetical protein
MPRATLTITLEDSGQVTVSGPLNDKVLMYGLLGAARDVVVEYSVHKAENKVQLATGAIPRLD